MILARRAIPIDELCRWFLAAALVVGLISATEASAESVSAVRSIGTAPHQCKCGMNCGEACCCGTRETQTRRRLPRRPLDRIAALPASA